MEPYSKTRTPHGRTPCRRRRFQEGFRREKGVEAKNCCQLRDFFEPENEKPDTFLGFIDQNVENLHYSCEGSHV